jgi:hypothetical protein
MTTEEPMATGRQPPRIGTGTYWLKASNMVLQDMSLLWASHGMSPSPVTTHMWWFPYGAGRAFRRPKRRCVSCYGPERDTGFGQRCACRGRTS